GPHSSTPKLPPAPPRPTSPARSGQGGQVPTKTTNHAPPLQSPEEAVYVLTLTTTSSLSEPLNALRRAHFLPHLNRTPAHLTLFHALPGSQLGRITAALEEHCEAQQPLRLATGRVFRMRRGQGWMDVLSEQDRRGWRPHWTVQNKADSDEAVDAAMREVRSGFRDAEGLATGCTLWRYEKSGRWTFERKFDFEGGK
ncbi:hypothetical protein diail_10438, partial [Diaporthe ilicicola]